MDSQIKRFITQITKDWTVEDWDDINFDTLHYHVQVWYEENGDIDLNDLTAQFEFEKYMGW